MFFPLKERRLLAQSDRACGWTAKLADANAVEEMVAHCFGTRSLGWVLSVATVHTFHSLGAGRTILPRDVRITDIKPVPFPS